MSAVYEPGVCRKCGAQVNDAPRCHVCRTLQPESGFRIKAEGRKPPINGFAMLSFVTGFSSWFFGVFGLLALCGIIFSVIAFVGIHRRGQSGMVFAVSGLIVSLGSFVFRTLLLYGSIYLLWWITDGLRY